MNRAQAIAQARKLLERHRAEPGTVEGTIALEKAVQLMRQFGLTDVDLEHTAVTAPARSPAAKTSRKAPAEPKPTPIRLEIRIGKWRIRGRL